jgi:hypothetical protein
MMKLIEECCVPAEVGTVLHQLNDAAGAAAVLSRGDGIWLWLPVGTANYKKDLFGVVVACLSAIKA